jgi:predicted MFS family arabinose efflux permease
METVRWARVSGLPLGVRAVLDALELNGRGAEALAVLGQADWREALRFCDRGQLTLLLGHLHWSRLPGWVQERLNHNLAGHRLHARRLRDEFLAICSCLFEAGVDFLVLKGFTFRDDFSADPSLRVQYDIDLYCPGDALRAAADSVLALGYEFHRGSEACPTDHLPALARKTGWRWRGDYFDPGIPPSVDLHFRFWDEETECLPAPGVDRFWARRVGQPLDGLIVPVLAPADALGYAALHLLRHLLRGSARPYHVYELAYFLDRSVDAAAFWQDWTTLHPPELRKLQAVSFCLAASWFGCRLPPVAQEEVERLPQITQRWFDKCAASPALALFAPNKEELWLHLPLVKTIPAKARVLRRRLLPPLRMPGAAGAGYAFSRLAFHACSLPVALWRGLGWWLGSKSLGSPFWRLLASASLHNLGAFIFFLLYSLYLLDLGYQEKFIGLVAGASSLGNIGGALLAAWMSNRFGLRTALALGFAGAGAVSVLRCLVSGEGPLLVSAVLGGVAASFWFVLFAPAVSSVVDERRRPAAFSLFVASGVGMGVLGGLAGGQLPGMFHGLLGLTGPSEAKRAALLAGSALCLLAAWPASRLSLSCATRSSHSRVYSLNPFLVRYLTVAGVWSLALGCIDPFLNAYLARAVGADVSQIGWLFSASHFVQAAAVMLSPLILSRFGLVGGVVSMQLATAVALASLTSGPPLVAAGVLCAMYKSFQAMCEPGTFSLLMGKVSASERSGAAALNFLVLFCTQAAAAAAAGAAISRLGYSVVLWSAAALAVVAAVMFRGLLEDVESPRGTRLSEDQGLP